MAYETQESETPFGLREFPRLQVPTVDINSHGPDLPADSFLGLPGHVLYTSLFQWDTGEETADSSPLPHGQLCPCVHLPVLSLLSA